MGDMLDWARREVELACKREAPDLKDGEFDYGCYCYKSALKAYESLVNDKHSGMSFSITKHILNRLMDGKPLTPIEDIPENWNHEQWHDKDQYQCNRMYSLFKRTQPDGSVRYSDIDRVVVYSVDSNIPFHNGHANRLIEEMFPITFPYIPEDKPYKVYRQDYLTDRRNGDFDTIAYQKVIKPDGNTVQIKRFFAESENGWRELTTEEFNERYTMHFWRERKEKKEKEQNENH